VKLPAHSLLGASGAHRWLNCPGSFQLSVSAPPRPASIYAATGTLAHNYIEKALSDALAEGCAPGSLLLPLSEIGQAYPVEGHLVPVDQALIDGVNVMLGYVHDAARQSDWVSVEFQVELDSYFPPTKPPPVLMFGRVDVALLDIMNETLEVIDYKNGSGVKVNPRENPQLLYYAAGVLAQLPDNQQRSLRTIKLTVVQPNAPGGTPIRSWEIAVIDLLMWVDDVLIPGVEVCAQDDPPLVPGPWCRFCPALHVCPRLQQDAVAMAKREFADHVLPDNPDDLAKQLDIAERASAWINAVHDYAVEQLKAQVRIPGWELVPTRPTRKWQRDEAEVAAALRGLGVGDAVIWETRLRSPARVEKLLSNSEHGRQVWSYVETHPPLMKSVSSGVKLARANTPDAREDFSNVDGE
jgi:hypothetical protein